ncbi:MAG TPA: TIGR01459 family HAD-type hydrolase [Bauldia sp.]|nr:TIGR01459 family HAD-type hydrolase [Bauldia sp.]
MTNTATPPAVAGLSALAPKYRYLLSDVWGVVHDGVHAFPAAVEAMERFREGGGQVVLITNAPRMKEQVLSHFDQLGVDRHAFDGLVTSGEAAHAWLKARPGARVLHLGPERDLPIYAGLDIRLSGESDAEIVSCTGLYDDETETPDDYADRFARWRAAGLPFLCANPDRIVERGHRLIWCAGALAEAYAAKGGETILIGKPHAPIYETALARFAELAGGPVDKAAILAVGDGAETDIRGANRAGLDVLFITGGIHADSFGDRARPDPARVDAFLGGAGLAARAHMPRLSW